MAVTERINGTMTVIRVSSVCQGCVPWESKHITMATEDGREYIWWGGNADRFYVRAGDRIQIRASINPKTGHLRSVKATNLTIN